MKHFIPINHIRLLSTGVFLVVALLFSCSSSHNTTSQKWNLAAIYNPIRSSLHPSYKIYHSSTESSTLFIKIFTSEMMFQPLGEGGSLMSNLNLEYTLFETSADSRQVTDSGSHNFKVYQESSHKFFITQIPVKALEGKSYSLKLMLRDNLSKTFNLSFLEVEKNELHGQQNFNLTNREGSPIFRNVIIGNGSILIKHANPSADSLYISYYKNDVPLPKPTFSVSPETSVYNQRDSLFVIDYSPNRPIYLSREGLYFIQFDTNTTEGVSIARFPKGFPRIQNSDDLIEPLAYITTSGEFSNLLEQKHGKLAADDFWIKSGGNTGRGREMIRIYYNRVYFSNYYFTNTIQGWKTDRGMVYIVYGPPHNIKKTANTETWMYYRKGGNNETISFTFNYKPGRYHVNQYQLQRSENHNWHWREAVYSWTNGEIFLLD